MKINFKKIWDSGKQVLMWFWKLLNDHHDKLTAIGTLLLFFVGFFSMCFLYKQVAEMRKETEWNQRPFLNTKITDVEFELGIEKTDKTKICFKNLDVDSLHQLPWMSISSIYVKASQVDSHWNTGMSPLRITCLYRGIITENLWDSVCHKKPERLIEKVEADDDFDRDIVISPNENYVFKNTVLLESSIDSVTFRQYNNSEPFHIYLYTYVRYESLFGKVYNLIYIANTYCYVTDTMPFVTFDTLMFIEKYRWDIGLSD